MIIDKKTDFFLMVILFLAAFIFMLTIVSATLPPSTATKFSVSKEPITETVAAELSIPARYWLTIHNKNPSQEYFVIYTLLDAKTSPVGSILVDGNTNKTVEFKFLPYKKNKGAYKYLYYIKGDYSGYVTDFVYLRVTPVKDIISLILPQAINRNDSNLTIQVKNEENIDLGEVKLIVASDVVNSTQTFNLTPYSMQTVIIPIDYKIMEILKAGIYSYKFSFLLNKEYVYEIEKEIKLNEYVEISTTTQSKFTFFSFTKTIIKKNTGNTNKFVIIEFTKNRFERAFTSFSLQPNYEKSGTLSVTSGFQKEIQPGESFVVSARTDYLLLIIIVVVIIIIIIVLVVLRRKRVIVKKKALRVRTTGGHFAYKIVVAVKNIGQEIKDIKLVDRIPALTNLYEKFGPIKPDKVDKTKLEWNFPVLAQGEEFIVSYIIYSKVKLLGKIYLPAAHVSYKDALERHKYSKSDPLYIYSEEEYVK